MADKLTPLFQSGNLTEPVSKLIDHVAGLVGAIDEPKRIRRVAAAEADATRIQAEAQVEAAKTRALGILAIDELAVRAHRRVDSRELRRQKNIEAIVVGAAHQLPNPVSTAPVDEDWLYQFLDECQDVSNEEMQRIWAKLLAGEIGEPGSYSLRTLRLVRALREADAKAFRTLCCYIWHVADGVVYIKSPAAKSSLASRGIHYAQLLHLQTLGLITVQEGVTQIEMGGWRWLEYMGTRYRLVNTSDRRAFPLVMYLLTDIGRELTPLCEVEPDEEYLQELIASWSDAGLEVSVAEGDDWRVLMPPAVASGDAQRD